MISPFHKKPYDFIAVSGDTAWWTVGLSPAPEVGSCRMRDKNDCQCQSSIRCAL